MIATHVRKFPGTVMMHKTTLTATVDHEIYPGISSMTHVSMKGIFISSLLVVRLVENKLLQAILAGNE